MNCPEMSLDVDAYLRRIGFAGPLRPTLAVLQELHLAHGSHIPFENLDILLGRPIRIDLDSVQAKLVGDRRGGYCFEQNTLFAAVLERAGFSVTRLAARVRLGTKRVLPRTHMLLQVDVNGRPWLADVGFGREGLLQPLPLHGGRPVSQYGRTFRVDDDSGLKVLRVQRADSWEDVYAFTLEPQYPVDFEMANHYTATHPNSRFTQMLTVQLPTPKARYHLINYELTVDRGATVEQRTITDEEERLRVLAEIFDLHFPPGTRFHVPFPAAPAS